MEKSPDPTIMPIVVFSCVLLCFHPPIIGSCQQHNYQTCCNTLVIFSQNGTGRDIEREERVRGRASELGLAGGSAFDLPQLTLVFQYHRTGVSFSACKYQGQDLKVLRGCLSASAVERSLEIMQLVQKLPFFSCVQTCLDSNGL